MEQNDKLNKAIAETEARLKEAMAEFDAKLKEVRAEMRCGFDDAKVERVKIRSEMLSRFSEQDDKFVNVFEKLSDASSRSRSDFGEIYRQTFSVKNELRADISVKFDGVDHNFSLVRQGIDFNTASIAAINKRIDQLCAVLQSKRLISEPV